MVNVVEKRENERDGTASEMDGLVVETVWLWSVWGRILEEEGSGPMARVAGSGAEKEGRAAARARAPAAVATSRGLIRVNPVSRHHMHRWNNRK